MNVIGLGGVGGRIAKQFEQYPQYNVVSVDHEQQTETTILVKKQTDPEAYEASDIDLTKLYACLTDEEVIMIVSGGSLVSALSLRILEGMKERQVRIVYVIPDPSLLNHKKALNEKIVRNVLQHLTRSGKFERIYLIDNQRLDQIAGDLPVIGYWDQINHFISNTVHMLNVYEHNTPVMGNIEPPGITSRISTIGLKEIGTGEEKLFYPLDDTREVNYIYVINEERLKKSSDSLKKIKEEVRSKTTELKTVSFSIFSTKYDRDIAYVVEHTSFVQEQR
jgi:hypothetical protein